MLSAFAMRLGRGTKQNSNWVMITLDQNGYIQFLPLLFVGWLVCQQGYTRTTERISAKLVTKPGFDPEQTLLTFGGDLGTVLFDIELGLVGLKGLAGRGMHCGCTCMKKIYGCSCFHQQTIQMLLNPEAPNCEE